MSTGRAARLEHHCNRLLFMACVRMEEMQAMREAHQKAMEAGRAAYVEEMERFREQHTEMKQERREAMEEGGDDGRQTGGE